MFFRRKNADGFDWHKYVRTTIKLRREHRRAKIEEIGRVAAGQVKAASDAAVHGVVGAAETGWRATAAAWRATIAQPAVAFPIALCGGVALVSGLYRWFSIAPDSQALLPLGLGLGVLVLVAPLVFPSLSPSVWRSLRMPRRIPGAALAPVVAAGVALLLGWFAWGRIVPDNGAPGTFRSASPSDGAASVLEGRATALSGEMVRLQGRLLHLSGIESPLEQQTCLRGSKQPWKCGEVALAALERLSRAKPFRCVMQGGPDLAGRTEANCTVDGRDVAGELVKDGHVFSTATYFGGYSALESAARRAGAGLWSGEADRPADYRAKIWDTAKASAPDGCPIKGHVRSNRKTYLMPWAPGYAQASVRTNRGERWFCDEAEAINAGFKQAIPDRQKS